MVADIIEAVQNADSHVPMGWSDERLAIADMDTSCHRYFVRVAGKGQEVKEQAVQAFGKAEVIELEGLDEFAVLTGVMEEAAFRKAAESLDAEILQTIRAEITEK